MARFEVTVDVQRVKKQKRQLLFSQLLLSVCVIMFIWAVIDNAQKTQVFSYFFFGINFGIICYERWRQVKHAPYYLDISDEGIGWFVDAKSKPEYVAWNEIRWIKNDKDTLILISRQSSFSTSFLLELFSAEQQEAIKKMIKEQGTTAGLRLVNF